MRQKTSGIHELALFLNEVCHKKIDLGQEGFEELAVKFEEVAKIEKSHEERYRKLLNNVEMQQVFEKAEETMWECRNCGHLVMGKKAPEVCPVCKHPQSYFEVRKENY